MGTQLNRWSRSVSAVVAVLGFISVATADKVDVTWNVPDGWTTKDIPTQAEQLTLEGKELEMEQTSACRQTLSGRAANVAEVIANTGSACAIFGVRDGTKLHGTSTIERDVWLKVSGGTYSKVVGGSWNYWKDKGQTIQKGDIFVELTGSGTKVTGDVIGASEKSAKDNVHLTGNALVVVSGGATVSGSILGGGTSHDGAKQAKIIGNTKVRILSPLEAGTSGSHILGGSKFTLNNDSNSSCLLHTGNTAVEVELESDAEGTFGKTIIGGSYADGINDSKATDYTITGNTLTSITAPNTVTFSAPIYGASVSVKKLANATVTSTSSTTINGGTYTNSIYAAGSGALAVVKGKATLTLQAGDFSGATIGVGVSGSTAGSSELVIAGTEAIDLSTTTIGSDFDALTLQGDLTLGTQRPTMFPSITADSTERTISITLTEAEQESKLVTLGSATAVPANLAVKAVDSTDADVTDWKLAVLDGKLVYVAIGSEHTWSTPTEGTNWADGLDGFQPGDSVTFGTNDAQESVTLPADGVRVETLTVQGNYAFAGTGGMLSATNVAIESNGALALNETSATTSGALLAVSDTLSVAGELSGTAGITASSATFVSGGTLSGTPTITADSITFKAGSIIKVNATEMATLVGTVSGEATIVLTDDATVPDPAIPFAVLKAPSGLELAPPNGYALADYADGCYRMYRLAPTWTPSGEDNSWMNLDCWTNLTVSDEVPTSGTVVVNFGSNTPATLTIDVTVKLDTLLVRGSVAGAIEFGETCSLTASKLLVETDLTIPTAMLSEDTTTLTGKTLTLSGGGDLSKPFTAVSKLALADGTFKLVDGVDLASITEITINEGATLDYNGKSFQSTPITLAGGTIANTATANALTGAVTLTEDSFVDTANGEVHFHVASGARNDLVLNGHKLTKTGEKLLIVFGTDVDKGTLRIAEGSLRISNDDSKDSTLSDTTISFAKGTSYNPMGWVRPKSGTITLDADEGAEVVLYKGQQYAILYDEGRFCNIVKTGLGTISVPFKKDYLWSGTLKVEAGTLNLYKTTTDDATISTGIDVAEGATLQKIGSTGKLFLKGALSGKGTIKVQVGSAVPTAANGYFTGTWKVAKDATLSSTSSVYFQFANGGSIEVDGTLKFDGSPALGVSVCNSAISGTGTIYINQNLTLWNTISCTGKVILKAGKTLTDTDKNDTVRSYSISGPDLECNGTITGTGGSVTIPAGKTLSGTGTIENAVTLNDGAVLGVSTATASSRLTLISVTAGGNVEVTLPASPASGWQLVKWTSAPAGTTYTASDSTPLSALAFLHAKDAGLYYDVMSIDDGTAGSDSGTLSNLSDAAKRILAEAAFAEGATSISTVTGKQGGEAVTADALDGALSCFELTPTVTLDGEVATITVTYDFGISGMSAVMVEGTPQVTVKAKVENGDAVATLASGAEIILQSKDKDAGEDSWAQVEGATFTQDGDVYKATLSLAEIENKTFRVLARTKE